MNRFDRCKWVLPVLCLAMHRPLTAGFVVFALVAGISPSRAQTGTDNLIRNPGFEEPWPATGDNPYANWGFVNHKQDFIRGEVQTKDCHSGRKAAAVSVGGSPQVYGCWCQHIAIKMDDQLPDEVSVWYRAPDNDAAIVLAFIGFEGGRSMSKGGTAITLPKSGDWRQANEKVQVPFGTRDIQFELRVSKPGEYRFDDVALRRSDAGPVVGKPSRILFVGATRLTYLWDAVLKAAGWDRVTFETWDNLTPGLLQQCRVVVMVGLPLRSDLTPQDQSTIKLLGDYVEAGGGLLLNQQAGQVITSQTLPFALARRFGTEILLEKTVSDPACTKQVGAWGSDQYTSIRSSGSRPVRTSSKWPNWPDPRWLPRTIPPRGSRSAAWSGRAPATHRARARRRSTSPAPRRPGSAS
jgi:hypothetical protein